MSYNVKTISVFERQAKRLIKKFPSLKKEIHELAVELKKNQQKVYLSGIIVIKYGLLSQVKEKENQGEPGLFHMLFLNQVSFICFLSMINPK